MGTRAIIQRTGGFVCPAATRAKVRSWLGGNRIGRFCLPALGSGVPREIGVEQRAASERSVAPGHPGKFLAERSSDSAGNARAGIRTARGTGRDLARSRPRNRALNRALNRKIGFESGNASALRCACRRSASLSEIPVTCGDNLAPGLCRSGRWCARSPLGPALSGRKHGGARSRRSGKIAVEGCGQRERHRRDSVVRSLSSRRWCCPKLRSGQASTAGGGEARLLAGGTAIAQPGIAGLPIEHAEKKIEHNHQGHEVSRRKS
jgi:hypothetical protein